MSRRDAFRHSQSPDQPLDVASSEPSEQNIEIAANKRQAAPTPKRPRRTILSRLPCAETPAPSVDAIIALREFFTRKQKEYRTIRVLANNQYDDSYRQNQDGKWTHCGVYSWRFSKSYTVEPFEPSKWPYRELYSEKKDLRFYFEADCPPTDPLYWLAELAIPPFASDLTVLRLKVTDVAGRPLDIVCRDAFGLKPYFAFGPQGYQIQDGFTPLTLSVFQNYFIKQTQIGVLFYDQLSPGSLRLLDAEAVAQMRAARK